LDAVQRLENRIVAGEPSIRSDAALATVYSGGVWRRMMETLGSSPDIHAAPAHFWVEGWNPGLLLSRIS
jgi:hypothetical protein